MAIEHSVICIYIEGTVNIVPLNYGHFSCIFMVTLQFQHIIKKMVDVYERATGLHKHGNLL
jgi:hypothetical protein